MDNLFPRFPTIHYHGNANINDTWLNFEMPHTFTKRPEMISSHIDKDIEIFNQRILHILERTIKKVKLVAACNRKRKNLLSPMSMTPASQSASGQIPEELNKADTQKKAPYHQRKFIWTLQSVLTSCLKADSSTKISPESKNLILDTYSRFFGNSKPDLSNKQCCNAIADILLSLDNEDLKDFGNYKNSPQVELFVQCVQELHKNVEFHQQENVTQERAREKEIRRAHLRNDQAKKEIAALEQELILKKSDLNASIIGKNILLNRHQAKIVKIQKTTKEAIERRKEESKTNIELDQRASQQCQIELNTQVEQNIIKHKLLLDEHLLLEKQLRMQRKKIENQLAAWMEKFDQDMSEKQDEEENLLDKFDEEKKQYEEIQKRLDEQEEEYDELMQEKAAYEQEVLEQKLFIFILNRSARRIQRAFRAYKLRKMAKKAKKGKKGKGKKK